jgi:hypothetical protein
MLTRMTSVVNRRVAAVIAAAALFGIAMSVVKGNDAGVRDTLGNVSAPWLLLPFGAGAIAGSQRLLRGALVGLVVSLAAMAGFYVTNAVVLDLGPHPWFVDLRLAVEGGRLYFGLAVLSGPVFGALGAYWSRTGSRLLGVAVASLLVVEPLAWLAYQRIENASLPTDPAVWVSESVIGVGACVLAARISRRVAATV